MMNGLIPDQAYRELKEALGEENVSREPAVLDGYAWQPSFNPNPDIWIYRPIAVALPSSTEEVQAVVRVCNDHGLKFKAMSSGWGAHAGPGTDGVVQIDMRRMDRILKIDKKNMYAVVESGAIGGVIRAEVMKAGLHTHMISAGAVSSPLASATSAWGCCWDGVYFSWSQRNILGVEWVLPDGEILRLGTLGSDYGWFCGDGPGPSLRGIMRGRAGAMGGNGVFTKCALKLYHWPGSPQPEGEGLLYDIDLNIPEKFKVLWCIFPDRQSLADATLKIAKEGVGYYAFKPGLGSLLIMLLPHILHSNSWNKIKSLRGLISGLQFHMFEILAANSQGELKWQEKTVWKATTDSGGFIIDTEPTKLGAFLFWGLMTGAVPPKCYRATGQFHTGWVQDESHHAMVDFSAITEKIKKDWIEKGGCLDDLGDTCFHFFCEEGLISHCEEVFWFDHRDRKQAEAVRPFLVDVGVDSIEKCMEFGFHMEPQFRKMFSPMQGNYNVWQRKIQEAFDPNSAADATLYTEEEDLDPSGLDPSRLEKLNRLIKEKSWTESGPPE